MNNSDDRMTVDDARKTLQVINNCCKMLLFTKSEINQIAIICLKAIERTESECDWLQIGLIDVDSHNFPNLPLMKLAAWHKSLGDNVEWYEPLFHSMGEPLDKVYMSKIFSFTPDYSYYVNAKEVIKGGSGYCISRLGYIIRNTDTWNS